MRLLSRNDFPTEKVSAKWGSYYKINFEEGVVFFIES